MYQNLEKEEERSVNFKKWFLILFSVAAIFVVFGDKLIENGNTAENQQQVSTGQMSPSEGEMFAVWRKKVGKRVRNKIRKKLLKKASRKCSKYRCCRPKDGVTDDTENCKQRRFKNCVDDSNSCVWDCSKQLSLLNRNHIHFDEMFLGINDPTKTKPLRMKDLETNSRQDAMLAHEKETAKALSAAVLGKCGEMYKLKLSEGDFKKLKQEEMLFSKTHTHGGAPDSSSKSSKVAAVPQGLAVKNEWFVEGQHMSTERFNELTSLFGNRRRLQCFSSVFHPDTRRDVTVWNWPNWLTTKIFFKSSAGTHSCSGALISPRHVLTAGHCVSDGAGNWYGDWETYPGYNIQGRRNKFGWSSAWTFSAWFSGRDFNYDVAIITLNTANTGYGWYGFGWDNGINAAWRFENTGYPCDKHNAQIMQHQDVYMDSTITADLLYTITGDLAPGSSGGPVESSHAYNWQNTGVGRVYGVVSHGSGCSSSGCQRNAYTRISQSKFRLMCCYIHGFSETSNHCGSISC